MKMPRAHQAYVQRAKITEYLLSPTHPDGRDKAAFFHHFGFRAEEWSLLADALRTHTLEYDVAKAQDTPFGIRYIIEGEIPTPSGRQPLVRSVWFVETGTTTPRLVSAYPLPRRKP